MKLRKLSLSVKRSKFREDDPSSVEHDAIYKKLKPEILKEKNHTCEFCGFKSLKYQHIHHLDDNHANNNKSNLVVACPLCHMTCHLGFAGERGMGTLIYLSNEVNVSQAEFNSLIRSLWIGSLSKNKDISIQSENMLERLYNMNIHTKRLLKTNDLTVIGDFLMGLSENDYKNRDIKMSGFYFLPLKHSFKKELNYWLSECKIPNSDDWIKIAENKIKLFK